MVIVQNIMFPIGYSPKYYMLPIGYSPKYYMLPIGYSSKYNASNWL